MCNFAKHGLIYVFICQIFNILLYFIINSDVINKDVGKDLICRLRLSQQCFRRYFR
jgi:hypothetical protein